MSPETEAAVRRYLDDLARMLEPADPMDRADTLEAIREHFDEVLAEQAARGEEHDVAAAAAELGPPSQIAAEALAGWPIPSLDSAVPRTTQPALASAAPAPVLERSWVPIVMFGLVALGMVPLYGWPPLIAGVVVFFASPLWTRAEKRWAALIGVGVPVAVGVALIAPSAFAQGVEALALEDFSGGGTNILVPATYDLAWSAVILMPLVFAVVATVIAAVMMVRALRRARG